MLLIQKTFYYFDTPQEMNAVITNKVKECVYTLYNEADCLDKRLKFLQLLSYKCSIGGNSIFSKALRTYIKKYQIPVNDILKFEVVELKGDSINERLYPITVVHIDSVKFRKIDLDKLIYDQLKELYRYTLPQKCDKVQYRKNKT